VHTGRFLGIEPTGRRVRWEFLDMYRAGADGRLNWHFLATDWNLVRLQLLGQAPDLPATTLICTAAALFVPDPAAAPHGGSGLSSVRAAYHDA
jgi:hypothetical protein